MLQRIRLAAMTAVVALAVWVANANLDACSIFLFFEPEPPR
ncbi:MAG: cyclic lactone autoinducer peptide [Syntrophomonadaceae bacterium]|nr:cyclic lactone autoinducer peptide [Syntrophomonadaceae bacterium]MDH7498418.1 cyclic lactone autoinducer peptide [Syntrophomonadaceae bacterium]